MDRGIWPPMPDKVPPLRPVSIVSPIAAMANVQCLVFEPDVTGHRLQHVRHLTEALLEIGCGVTLALQTDCRDHAEYDVHLKALEPDVRLCAQADPKQSTKMSARRRRVAELLEAITRLQPQWAYVPYADGITQAAAIESVLYGDGPFRSVPIEAQIMRGNYGYPQQSAFDAMNSAANRWLTRHNPWYVTHVLDPLAMRGLEPLHDANAFRLIPEPVEALPQLDRQEARQALGVPTDGRYVGVVGGLHPLKRIDSLLAGFKRAKLNQDDRLLFVGKMHPAIRELIRTEHQDLARQQRIATVDRYVSDHDLDCGFLAADVIAVSYPRPVGSSGTLVRAVAAGRPVVASNFGWVGWVTSTFKLGKTVDVVNIDDYAAAIETTIDASATYCPSEAATRFCQYHTVANQKAHWVAEIGRELGLPTGPLSNHVEWKWVLEAVN